MNIIKHEKNGISIMVRDTDGYVNLTEIARTGEKRLDNWLSNKYVQTAIEKFNEEERQKALDNPGYEAKEMVVTTRGRYAGTWGHPYLTLVFAVTVDPIIFLWIAENFSTLKNPEEGLPQITEGSQLKLQSGEMFELGQLQAQQENLLERIAAIEHTQLSTTKMALAAFNNASQTQANAEILRAIHEATNKKSDELRMMERHLREMTVALAQKSYTPKGHDNNSNEKSTLEEMMEEQLEKAQQIIQELGRRIEEVENHKNLIIRGFIQGGCFSIEELCSSSKEELNPLEAVDLERLQCQEYINLLEDYDDLWKEFNEYLARRGQATLEQDEYRPSLGRALKSPRAYIREYMINNEKALT